MWQEPFDTAARTIAGPTCAWISSSAPRKENAMGYQRWWMEHAFAIAPATAYVGWWLQSFKEFPPRQKPGSFNLDRVMEWITAGSQGKQ